MIRHGHKRVSFGHRKASLGRLREMLVAHIQCVHICPRAKWNKGN
jgi:hypothetical protein